MISLFKSNRVRSAVSDDPKLITDGNSVETSVEDSLHHQNEQLRHDKEQLQLEVERFQRENLQFRRELNDANSRIRELRDSLLVSITNAADDDASSVEVQSVDLSTTSSTTTLHAGSRLAMEERWKQRQRDDEKLDRWRATSMASGSRRKKKNNAKAAPYQRSLPYWSDPMGETNRRSMSKMLTPLADSDSDSLAGEHLLYMSLSDVTDSDASESRPMAVVISPEHKSNLLSSKELEEFSRSRSSDSLDDILEI